MTGAANDHAALVTGGLLIGSFSAMLAVVPQILNRPQALPWMSMGLTLGAVFLVAMTSGLAALVPTLRSPLLPALRTE